MTELQSWTLTQGLEHFCQNFLKDDTGQLASALLPIAQLETAAKRDILFLEGEQGQRMYFVLEGVVKLSKLGRKGNEVTVFLAQSDDVFAEILSHLNFRYPVTATVLEPATLLSLNVKAMEDQLEAHPKLAGQFIAALAQRIKHLMKTIERLTIEDLQERFLAFLDSQLEGSDSNLYTLPVSKKEMAQLMGVTPETFSRMLRALEESNQIQPHENGLIRLHTSEPE